MFITGIIKYIQASYREFNHKMTWITYEELQKLATHFFIAIIVITIIVAVINMGLSSVKDWMYRAF